MKRPSSLSIRQQVRMSVPNNSQWLSIKKIEQQIIKFPYLAYPFPNNSISADHFNTIVQCNINQQKIDKIVKFKCQNVIALKKIVKIKKTNKNSLRSNSSDRAKNPTSTYSFYYEKVEYSLAYIFQSQNKQSISCSNKFNLDKTQIKKTLANVVAALYIEGIIIFLEFSHVGINEKGVIKVYIAPNVLFDRHDYNPKTKVLILTYLNNVLKQIDTKFPTIHRNKHSIESIKFKPELSMEKDVIQQSFIVQPQLNSSLVEKHQLLLTEKRRNLLNHEEKSLNEKEENFIGASGSTNLDHLKLQKKITKKFQSQNLESKMQQNIETQKKSTILRKLQQKQKIEELTFQLEQMRRKIRYKIEEKRERNFYASKVFKTLATEDHTRREKEKESVQKTSNKILFEGLSKPIFQPVKRSPIQKKRKSSQSSINFYQGVISQQKNINCINIYNPKHFPQKSHYQMPGDDGMSVDTYELEIGDDYEMPCLSVPTAMRNSMSPQKKRDQVKNSFQVKENSNGNKSRFSESAGGKSYGHIVNLLKPQFIAKKSNIFEEPENQNQEDSKNSVSLKKSIGKSLSDRLSAQKRFQNNIKPKNLASLIQSQGQQINGLKTVEQFKSDLKHIMRIGTELPQRSSNPKNKQFHNRLTLPTSGPNERNPEMDFIYLRETEYRPKTNHKITDILVKKCALEEKVKKVMERTKNAINVLQTAKIRQSGSSNTLKKVFSMQ